MATNTLAIIDDPAAALRQGQEFIAFLDLSKQVNQAWKAIEATMKEHNVKSIRGDWGSLTIAERKNWKATTELDDSFYKKTLDTAKLNALFAGDATALPAGLDFMVTPYLSRRVK